MLHSCLGDTTIATVVTLVVTTIVYCLNVSRVAGFLDCRLPEASWFRTLVAQDYIRGLGFRVLGLAPRAAGSMTCVLVDARLFVCLGLGVRHGL